jgi:nickel/cobalt exporter
MPDIPAALAQNAATAWLYLPAAVLLGALHGLEPGHSKSLMAAFIIAIRGTARQALLLGASAAVGHTIIVWTLAALGLWLGDRLIADRAEPWLVLLSGLLVIALALRLIVRMRPRRVRMPPSCDRAEAARNVEGHGHDPGFAHHHAHRHDHAHHHGHVDAQRHDHDHLPPAEMAQRYGGRAVTTGEIVWFGFTGGLLPCPAAIGVLLVSLQMREFALGMTLVVAFSLGLAATLMGVGLIAAWGARRAGSRFRWLDRHAAALPVLSAVVILFVGAVVVAQGLRALALV